MEDVRAQLQTMSSAAADINTITNMIKAGQEPKGKIVIIHGNKDPLAEPEKSSWLAKQLGLDQVSLNIINNDNHVLEQSPTEQNYAVSAISRL